jgi:hypothetical protein
MARFYQDLRWPGCQAEAVALGEGQGRFKWPVYPPQAFASAVALDPRLDGERCAVVVDYPGHPVCGRQRPRLWLDPDHDRGGSQAGVRLAADFPGRRPRGLLERARCIRRVPSPVRRVAGTSCPRLPSRRPHRQLHGDRRTHPVPHLELVRRPEAAGLPVGAKPLRRPGIRGWPQRTVRPVPDGHARQLRWLAAGRLAAVATVLRQHPSRLALVRPRPRVASPITNLTLRAALGQRERGRMRQARTVPPNCGNECSVALPVPCACPRSLACRAGLPDLPM